MKKIQIIQTPPLAVDKRNAAAAIGVSETTLDLLVRSGELPPPRKLSANRVGWLWRELSEYAETRPVSNLLPVPTKKAEEVEP